MKEVVITQGRWGVGVSAVFICAYLLRLRHHEKSIFSWCLQDLLYNYCLRALSSCLPPPPLISVSIEEKGISSIRCLGSLIFLNLCWTTCTSEFVFWCLYVFYKYYIVKRHCFNSHARPIHVDLETCGKTKVFSVLPLQCLGPCIYCAVCFPPPPPKNLPNVRLHSEFAMNRCANYVLLYKLCPKIRLFTWYPQLVSVCWRILIFSAWDDPPSPPSIPYMFAGKCIGCCRCFILLYIWDWVARGRALKKQMFSQFGWYGYRKDKLVFLNWRFRQYRILVWQYRIWL